MISRDGKLPVKRDKYMNLDEFVDKGYLQEVNRQFFHPLGLALTVRGRRGKVIEIEGLWDCRDDPEGISLESINWDKVYSVRDEQEARRPAREEALGYWVQGEP